MPPRPPGPEPWLWASCADGPGPMRAPRNFDHRVAGGTAAQPPPAGRGAQRRVNARPTSGAGTLALGAVCGWTGADESAAEFRPPRSGRHGGAAAARRAGRAARIPQTQFARALALY